MMVSPEKQHKVQVLNPTPQNESGFDYKDLNTIGNFWVKFKGKMYNGKRRGLCQIFLFNGDKLYVNFKNDMANGKGIYYQKGGEKITGVWKDNKMVESLKKN